ncbi:FKBP-type peptidyl-prolyl cis-trans isomerase [Patescibacteria group bacterium]|nr:FKBP-type peptidyl-prolyl cis-trans isomerase [Patescibacteria group bacterium]
MILAQIITPHKIIIKINNCKIMEAVTDGQFDELKNEPIIPSSLGIEILKQGEGEQAKTGDRVSVNYSGRLLDGEEFDSNFGKDSPFVFTLGAGYVIEGWDLGLLGMRVGERRKLTIPPDLAYGSSGTPGGPIPPNATLIFEVELLGINN